MRSIWVNTIWWNRESGKYEAGCRVLVPLDKIHHISEYVDGDRKPYRNDIWLIGDSHQDVTIISPEELKRIEPHLGVLA